MLPTYATILMGPSGCGKSTVGAALAERVAWSFIEGDDFHPKENVAKIGAGTALTDDDRATWIDGLVTAMDTEEASRVVVSCSALTPYVQQRLVTEGKRKIRFVLLQLSREELESRLNAREGHYMQADLLSTQLDALSIPDDALVIDASQSVADVVLDIAWALGK